MDEFPDIFSNNPNFNNLNARDNNFSSISEGICGAIYLLIDSYPFENNMICDVPACLDDIDLGCQNCDGVDCGDDGGGGDDEGCEPCDGADGCGSYYSENECLSNEGCEWLGQDGPGCEGCDPCVLQVLRPLLRKLTFLSQSRDYVRDHPVGPN